MVDESRRQKQRDATVSRDGYTSRLRNLNAESRATGRPIVMVKKVFKIGSDNKKAAKKKVKDLLGTINYINEEFGPDTEVVNLTLNGVEVTIQELMSEADYEKQKKAINAKKVKAAKEIAKLVKQAEQYGLSIEDLLKMSSEL